MGATISVVITSRDTGRYLRECLESVLAQERPADEILVVDDASADETRAIAARYADRGVRYERVDYRSLGRSYNHGIAATDGELIAILDADKALLPPFLGTLAAALDADAGLGFAYPDWLWAGEFGAPIWRELGVVQGMPFRGGPPDPAALVHRNIVDGVALVRRSAVAAVGGFGDLPALWDYRLWVALLEAGWRGHHVAAPLYHYRLHRDAAVLATRAQQRGCALQIRREHFGAPFWAPYARPDLAVDHALVPGQPQSGGTPCALFITPRARGAAVPARVRLGLALPPGLELLEQQDEGEAGGAILAGGRAALDLAYPLPSGGATAAPTVRFDLLAREAAAGAAVVATLDWEDLFEVPHRATARIALDRLRIAPPVQQAIVAGPVQEIRGHFGAGEWVSAWAAMPADAARPSVALPPTEADADGTVRVDLRPAPLGFAGVVVQGEALRNQVVLVPAGPGPAHAAPGLLARGTRLGRRALAVARRRARR